MFDASYCQQMSFLTCIFSGAKACSFTESRIIRYNMDTFTLINKITKIEKYKLQKKKKVEAMNSIQVTG